jgi:hypothetical protein
MSKAARPSIERGAPQWRSICPCSGAGAGGSPRPPAARWIAPNCQL